MTDSVFASFLTIAVLVIINIALAAYSYGKLGQKVNDACRRITRLEMRVNGHGPYKPEED
ncbi:hypothetical protein ACFLXC_04655 [Chloroflexota bacterium]